MDSSLIKKPMDSSEPTAEESFRARVQKAFGPLSSSQSPWSLTDDEIEKREWNRSGGGTRDDDVIPCSSSFDGISFSNKDRKKRNPRRVRRDLENDGLEDQNDDEDGEEGDGGDGGDEWEIRSSIGLDRTLDNEVSSFFFIKSLGVGLQSAQTIHRAVCKQLNARVVMCSSYCFNRA